MVIPFPRDVPCTRLCSTVTRVSPVQRTPALAFPEMWLYRHDPDDEPRRRRPTPGESVMLLSWHHTIAWSIAPMLHNPLPRTSLCAICRQVGAR